MNLITYPLNNIEYRAEDAELFHCTRTSGVWAEKSFTCTVSGEDNNITVDKGVAWIQNTEFAGKVVAMKGVTVIDAGVADDLNDRIDVVAIQFDANENETKIVVKHGDPVLTNPQIPEINRSGGLFELYLCSIYRTAGKTAISSSDVTDLRLNPDYCGLMADSVTKIDTSMIESQVTELINFLKSQIDDLSLTAENVTYDNSESEIEAENLQAAVDHIIQSIINNYYNKKTTNNLINDAKTDASKVATNYLSLIDSTKLEIGIIDGNSWKGYRTQIASNAVNIFGTDNNEVASFCLDNIKLNSAQVDVTGRICGTTQGVSWYLGRDYATLIATGGTGTSAYFPVIDTKCHNGDWSIGTLGDYLYFVYTRDTNYSAGTNTTSKITFNPDGHLILPKSASYQVTFGDGSEAVAVIPYYESSGYKALRFGLPNGGYDTLMCGKDIQLRGDGTLWFYPYYGKANNPNYWGICVGVADTNIGPCLRPMSNDYCSIGANGIGFRYIYATHTGIQNTSDRRLKENISDDFSKLEKAFKMLRPVTYDYKHLENDDNMRIGFIAQEVWETLEVCGIDPYRFAAIHMEKVDPETDIAKFLDTDETYYLNYTEFTALNTYMIQKLMKRIEELEKRIA